MSVTLILVGRNPWMPRAYMSGFVGSSGTSNMTLAGDTLSFDYLAPIYHVDLVLKHEFAVPSSNRYSLDWIFDAAASQVYQSGSPIAAGVGIKFYPMTIQPTWRIQVLATLPVDETITEDLFPLPGYWRPLA